MSETLGPRLTRERRKSFAFLACALGAVLLFAAAYATAIAEGGGETYTVKKGDTLWDIASEKLGEATRWPEIWDGNRHIKDPHWIYPGDQIHFAGTGEAAGQVVHAPAPAAGVVDSGPPKLYYSRAHSAGFVGEAEYKNAGKIISSYHDVENLYEGLEVFIDRGEEDGVRPGDWFLVFRPGEPVLHPLTKKPAGVRKSYRSERTPHGAASCDPSSSSGGEITSLPSNRFPKRSRSGLRRKAWRERSWRSRTGVWMRAAKTSSIWTSAATRASTWARVLPSTAKAHASSVRTRGITICHPM
jgi:hypothetical protein